MDIGGYSMVDALRGEMGASLVKLRVMETALQYVISTMNSDFENIKEMMLDTIETGKGRWYTNTNSYREELGITWDDLYEMPKKELKRRIRVYDTEKWYLNLASKSTLKYYAEGKTRIGYEFCYRNNLNSTYLARARTNSLKLEEAKGRGNPFYNTVCKICGQGEEDIVHFLIECKVLEGKRDYNLIDNSIEDPKDRMVELLFNQEDYQGTGNMIKRLWGRRKAILKYIQESEYENRDDEENEPTPLKEWSSDPGPVRECQTPIRLRSLGNSVARG